LLVRAVATPFGASEAALLLAAYAISLAAFVGALFPLYRLTEFELARRLARPTLLLLAVFPAAVYFGAPYSERLFLLLAVGAFYAARSGHWAWAGSCAAFASASRRAASASVAETRIRTVPAVTRVPRSTGVPMTRPAVSAATSACSSAASDPVTRRKRSIVWP